MTLAAIVLLASVTTGASGQVPAPGQAAARPTPLLGLRPGLSGKTTLEKGHYQYAVVGGAVVRDTVEVLNLSSETQTFGLYGADLVQSIGGGVAPTFPTDKQRDAGAWIALDSDSVQLAPHDKTVVGFTVKVPALVAPGDHLGAVVASAKSPSETGGLSVESRVALTVRVRIPGVAHLDGTVGPLQVSKGAGGRRFTVEVHNTGNLLFTIGGRIDVTRGRQTVAVLPVAPKDVYIIPNGVARFEGAWSSIPFFGSRRATAIFKLSAFRQPDATRRSNAVSMSFFSWWIIVLAIIVLLGVAAAFIARRRSSISNDAGFDGADSVAVSVGSDPADGAETTRSDSREWYS